MRRAARWPALLFWGRHASRTRGARPAVPWSGARQSNGHVYSQICIIIIIIISRAARNVIRGHRSVDPSNLSTEEVCLASPPAIVFFHWRCWCCRNRRFPPYCNGHQCSNTKILVPRVVNQPPNDWFSLLNSTPSHVGELWMVWGLCFLTSQERPRRCRPREPRHFLLFWRLERRFDWDAGSPRLREASRLRSGPPKPRPPEDPGGLQGPSGTGLVRI